jgi:hypothetical protein
MLAPKVNEGVTIEKSGIELRRLLDNLQYFVPALIREYPDDHDFMPAFVQKLAS